MNEMFLSARECEAAFYAAFNAGDFPKMEQVWAMHTPVCCVHPAGPLLEGRDAVLSSWRQILGGAGAMRLRISDHRVIEHADLALRFVHEHIEHGAHQHALVLASNVYVREAGGWKLCSHHASTAPMQRIAAQPRTTMH